MPYKVTVTYSDKSVRTFETDDGAAAMRETSSSCYQEDKAKTVSLEKDGTAIFSEKVAAYDNGTAKEA